MRHVREGFISVLALTAGLVLAPTIHASPLRTADLNAPGDGLLTIDENSGLAFLDPLATRAVSFNDTLLTPFVTEQGFRFATLTEFETLLTNAGFTDFSGNFNTADQAVTENLLENFVGQTITPDQPFTINPPGTRFDADISDGFYSFALTPGTPPGLVNVVGVDYQSAALGQAPQDQTRVILDLNQVALDDPRPIVGGLLVRSIGDDATVVPEPSNLALMGFGLLMMAGVGFLQGRGRRLHR